MEVITKSPKAKKKNDYKKESQISSVWYEEINSLMEEATEALNKTIRWSDLSRRDEIKKETAGMSKEQIKKIIEEDIEEYRRATDIVNQKIEVVYGEMEGVEIEESEMTITSSQEIIDNLF